MIKLTASKPSRDWSPNSGSAAVVYLMKYESDDSQFYKIGIANKNRIEGRRKDLERSVNRSLEKKTFSVSVIDTIEFENKVKANQIELMFHRYARLRDKIPDGDSGRAIDGNSEIFSVGIIKKWNSYKENLEFDPSGLPPTALVRYCIHHRGGSRWEEAEDHIAKNPGSAILYSREIIRGMWKEKEDIILSKDLHYWREKRNHRLPYDIHDYALFRDERWIDYETKVENQIKDLDFNSGSMASYSDYRLKKRIHDYTEKYLQSPWESIEPTILANWNYSEITRYCLSAKRERWFEFEKKMLESLDIGHGKFRFPPNGNSSLWTEEKRSHHSTLKDALKYSKSIIKERWPELEKYIISERKLALDYCQNIICEPWELFEKKYPDFIGKSITYSAKVKKERSTEIEEKIIQGIRTGNFQNLEGKIGDYLRIPDFEIWQELEECLIQKFEDYPRSNDDLTILSIACIYGANLRGWSRLEKFLQIRLESLDRIENNQEIELILTYFVWHCSEIGKKRDKNIEKRLLESNCPHLVVKYSINCVGKRWPEAEGVIVNSGRVAIAYAKFVIQGRWPELEAKISNYKSQHLAASYAFDVLNDNWPEANIFLYQHSENQAYANKIRMVLYRKLVKRKGRHFSVPHRVRKSVNSIVFRDW